MWKINFSLTPDHAHIRGSFSISLCYIFHLQYNQVSICPKQTCAGAQFLPRPAATGRSWFHFALIWMVSSDMYAFILIKFNQHTATNWLFCDVVWIKLYQNKRLPIWRNIHIYLERVLLNMVEKNTSASNASFPITQLISMCE